MFKEFLYRGILSPVVFGFFAAIVTHDMELGWLVCLAWTIVWFPAAAVLAAAEFPLVMALAGALWVPAFMALTDFFWTLGQLAPYGSALKIFPFDPYGGRGAFLALCSLSALAGGGAARMNSSLRAAFRSFSWNKILRGDEE